MTERERGRERDLVLAPNEYAFIADETKGNINAYIGPYKSSLANTDQPVVFNLQSKRFERCSLEQAVLTFAVAPVGWYLVLKNPTHDGAHPKTGAINNLVELQVGRKVNLPGPVSFALWPGQMARVIQGHHLRSNQYLVVRVYDEEAAKANWKNAVIKPQTPGEDAAREPEIPDLPDLTMGKLLVIKGTDVSFYIPPTGVEVVPDAGSDYVREAVTLERLEYCILLDESGNKSYLQGPAVVFPRPTEVFVQRGGARKFRAIELSENSGIYLKVIAPYTEDGREYRVGDELFITGKDRMIYFPRPEHAAIKYGDQAIHYAVAIPAGEARYVLDRNSGQIRLERGPCIFLPDPRREVIVRRVLDRRQVELWFPGNAGALAHNEKLARSGEGGAPALARRREAADEVSPPAAAPTQAVFAGDDFTRSQTFSQPRTIVLDNRYDGAVSISVWTGYAVLAVSKTSERKVIVGPATYLLEYDEVLQAMELSTGTPKTDDDVERTAYLRVLYNKVSDVVEAETRDLVKVEVRLSYRVNFEGDPQRWFNVENYVKFLTEHLRSLLRGAIKQRAVQEFYPQAVAIVRDVVLGAQGEDGTRTGRRFDENGMRVYDVEVLGVEIGDEGIETLLVGAQHAVVEQTLTLDEERRRLELTREREGIEREVQAIQAGTRTQSLALQRAEVGATFELERAKIAAEAEGRKARLDATLADQPAMDTVHAAELARRRSTGQLEAELSNDELALRLRELEAEVHAVAEKARAVSPDLVAALTAFGDRALAEKMAQSMAPLAILGGESVSEVLARLLRGTKLARVLAPALADDAGKPPQESPDEGQ